MVELVPVYNSTHLTEIAVIKSKLEAGNIDLFVQNYEHAQMAHIDILALGGMNILVPESQVEEALAIINEPGEFLDTDIFDDYNPPWQDVPPYKASLWPIVSIFMVALFMVIFTDKDILAIPLIGFALFLYHAQTKASDIQARKDRHESQRNL